MVVRDCGGGVGERDRDRRRTELLPHSTGEGERDREGERSLQDSVSRGAGNESRDLDLNPESALSLTELDRKLKTEAGRCGGLDREIGDKEVDSWWLEGDGDRARGR